MPELPEVEVTKRGIEPYLQGAVITGIVHDDKQLREPYSPRMNDITGGRVSSVERRAKYIIIRTNQGCLILHLGMTGHLRVLEHEEPAGAHDHFSMILNTGTIIRFNDVRRFGLIVYVGKGEDPYSDKHLTCLGPEPFSAEFNKDYLLKALSKRKLPIKQALMNNSVVVGVGNIYASEVLFKSGISPQRKACKISPAECDSLCRNIRETLTESISKGGTTIRDFSGADGKMGYFVQNLFVYGHKDQPCRKCGTTIESIVQGGRSTFYCPHCQK